MTLQNFSQYKEALEKEKALLLRELESVGRINPDDKNDWEPTASDLNVGKAEVEERAMQISDFEGRSSVEFQLEERLHKVQAALDKIENKTFGTCRMCQKQIEEDRLVVNPAATTCKEHKDA